MKTFKEYKSYIEEKVLSKTTGEKVKELFTGKPAFEDPYIYIKKRYEPQIKKIVDKIRNDVLKEEWNTKFLKEVQEIANKNAKELLTAINVQADSRMEMTRTISEKLLESVIWSNIASYIKNKG